MGVTLGIVEELAVLVEEFEGIPLLGVMAGGEDDTAGSLFMHDSQFGGRRGSQTDIDHVVAHTDECTAYDMIYHLAAQACITSYDNLAVLGQRRTTLGGIRCRETNYINGIQTLSNASAYRSADTGNTLNKTHIIV